MNATPNEILTFVRNIIEAENVDLEASTLTYNSVKIQCLRKFAGASFDKHKSLVNQLLQSRDQVYSKEPLNPSNIKKFTKQEIRSGLLVLTANETEAIWKRWMGIQNTTNDLQMFYENKKNDE